MEKIKQDFVKWLEENNASVINQYNFQDKDFFDFYSKVDGCIKDTWHRFTFTSYNGKEQIQKNHLNEITTDQFYAIINKKLTKTTDFEYSIHLDGMATPVTIEGEYWELNHSVEDVQPAQRIDWKINKIHVKGETCNWMQHDKELGQAFTDFLNDKFYEL
jgi:hypothetical protein